MRKRSKLITLALCIVLATGLFVFVVESSGPGFNHLLYGPGHEPLGRGEIAAVVNLSNPHRTALWIACEEGQIASGMVNEDLGLAPPGAYTNDYTDSIAIAVNDALKISVTLRLKNIRVGGWLNRKSIATEGDEIVYAGRCEKDEVLWTVCGTLRKHLLEHAPTSKSTSICGGRAL